ncbi:MAG: FG-GAP repeat protein [Planctomycetota bacterium]
MNPASQLLGGVFTAAVLLCAPAPATRAQCDEGWFTAFDGTPGDQFGFSVAVSGDVAVVGGPWANGVYAETGAAYVYRHQGPDWVLEQKLTASDGLHSDRFGAAVSCAGNVIVVGAPGLRDRGLKSGGLYVFRYDGSTWLEEQKLLAPDGKAGDELGTSVAAGGDVVAAGAPLDDDNGSHSGGVYVYRHDGISWFPDAKLNASDGGANEYFGTSVAVFGDRIVVGAPFDDAMGGNSGSAYVFRYEGTDWTEEQKLNPSDGHTSQSAGQAVAAGDGRLLVGAPGDDALGSRAGAAYVFRFDDPTWVEEQKLVGSDTAPDEFLGSSVALSDNRAVAGGPGAGFLRGLARVFCLEESTWIEDAKLEAPPSVTLDQFGYTVGVSGPVVFAGIPFDDDLGIDSGTAAAYRDAAWLNYGEGWPGTNGVPGISLEDDPCLGAGITLHIDNCLGAETVGSLIVGLSPASIDTLLQGTLLVVPRALLMLAIPAGGLSLPAELPCDRFLLGLSVYLQALISDPGASFGVAFSPGLEMQMGNF